MTAGMKATTMLRTVTKADVREYEWPAGMVALARFHVHAIEP